MSDPAVVEVPEAHPQVVGEAVAVQAWFDAIRGGRRDLSCLDLSGPGPAAQATPPHGTPEHAYVPRLVPAARIVAGQTPCGPGIPQTTQIYEGTNQIQRVVVARNLLK